MRRSRFALAVVLCACSSSSTEPAASSDAGTSDTGTPNDASTSADASSANDGSPCNGPISCHETESFVCDEYPTPTPAQCADLPLSCAVRGGVLASPAACPTAGFIGKCTVGPPGNYTLRFYQGYAGDAESYCTTTAKGTWSTSP